MSASSVACAPTDSIAVEWRIENFKRALQGTDNRALTSEPLSHASYPGIAWQVQVYPRNTSPSPGSCLTVGVYLHALIHVTNVHARRHRTEATSVKALFKFKFKKNGESLICSSLRQSDMRTFGHASRSWGFVDFAKHSVVEPLCADDGSILLVGEILPEKAQCQHIEFSRQMFASGKHSDFQVILGSETLQLHKWIFANASPVLASLVETRSSYRDVDAQTSPEAMLTLLQHLYGYGVWFKKLPILACDVLALAEKFQIRSDLRALCFSGLRESMATQTAAKLFADGVERGYVHLKTTAVRFIYEHVTDVFQSTDYKDLKETKTDVVVAMCEQLLKQSTVDPESGDYTPRAKRARVSFATPAANANSTAAASIPLERCDRISVRFLIPNLRGLMQTCRPTEYKESTPFTHESLPGLCLQLVVYPNGKSVANNCVGVFLRHVSISANKSAATAPSSGFSLAFRSPSNERRVLPEQVLPVQAFQCGQDNERGIACFARHVDIHRLYASDGPALLCGDILIEPATRPVAHSRRRLETGENSDFKIKFGNETFNAHTFVLSNSPVIGGMFGLNCTEMEDKQLTIRGDTTIEAVKAMLQFWYGDPLLFDGLPDLALEVLVLADEYQDWELVRICEKALLSAIKLENVLSLAAVAFRHKAPDLAKATVDFLAVHFDSLMQNHADMWTRLKDSNIKLALEIAEAAVLQEAATRSN